MHIFLCSVFINPETTFKLVIKNSQAKKSTVNTDHSILANRSAHSPSSILFFIASSSGMSRRVCISQPDQALAHANCTALSSPVNLHVHVHGHMSHMTNKRGFKIILCQYRYIFEVMYLYNYFKNHIQTIILLPNETSQFSIKTLQSHN